MNGFYLAAAPASGFDINLLLTLVGGATGAAAVWKIIGLVVDKLVPTRTDRRSDIESTFKVLSDTLELLRKDREQDQAYLSQKQERIVTLETEAERDYNVLKALRDERDELQERLRQKTAAFDELVHKIEILGANIVTDSDGHFHINLPGIAQPSV